MEMGHTTLRLPRFVPPSKGGLSPGRAAPQPQGSFFLWRPSIQRCQGLKVMSAIERCRTAALGGHVVRAEGDVRALIKMFTAGAGANAASGNSNGEVGLERIRCSQVTGAGVYQAAGCQFARSEGVLGCYTILRWPLRR